MVKEAIIETVEITKIYGMGEVPHESGSSKYYR